MKNTLSYLVFALVASTSSLAFGLAVESPCDLLDCAEGEVCEILPTPECSCPEPAPGEDAPVCDCDAQPPVAVCIPAPPEPCDSDNECAGDDVCVTYTYGSCSGSDVSEPNCGPDDEENCADPAPEPAPAPECSEETESICVPKYAAPCESASDCGVGFTCETPEICTCIAGAPIACDSEDPNNCEDIPTDDDCSCEPAAGEGYCQIIPVECTSDSDCEDGASCQSEYGGGTATDTAIACDPDSNCEEDPVAGPSYCIPEGYGEWTTSGGTDHTDGRKAESAKRTSFFNPGKNSGSGSGNGDKTSAGCTVSQGPTGFGAGALILFAMMFGFRRKKK